VERQAPTHASGADDGEAAARGQVSPPLGVRDRADAAAVRRDHERERRRRILGAVFRRHKDNRRPWEPIVRSIADPPPFGRGVHDVRLHNQNRIRQLSACCEPLIVFSRFELPRKVGEVRANRQTSG
jgi:hypothetical protein